MEETTNYIEAFKRFAGVKEGEFSIELTGKEGAYVHYDDKEFRVCRYTDLLWEFKTYFNDDYDLIYTETPFELWGALLEDHNEITQEDLIIDIYKAWKLYWDSKRKDFLNESHYTKVRNLSWGNFQELIEKVKSNQDNTLQDAIEISDMDFVPILALAIRYQFKNEDDFYAECVRILIEEYPDLFSDDGNFDKVVLTESAETKDNSYYIFSIES
ncbi:hypothetical protein [Taibaiella chishuiensis]|uniref:DUF4303 domain-containing protein n=1 Tax=Taibaiella chishuiensis TaxID=1434707 RepID=A0A2P8D0M8_9BACT|nr:hypothetical protein [Taibaiella chishuiensis]PSK90771.1 hypothetical protein B0I18_107183 [Taibaiella chishuiensis]